MTMAREYIINRRRLDPHQVAFVEDRAKRVVVRAGRRGGKTTGAADASVGRFLQHRRVLYAVPTIDQLEAWWFDVTRALAHPIAAGYLYTHEGKHLVEVPGTRLRIRGKTAHNPKTLRGDYADFLILDEYQDMDPAAWDRVGAPMLIDNNGDAMFCFTQTLGKPHIADLIEKAREDETGRWAYHQFSSHANTHVSQEAITDISKDMTWLTYQIEIMAADVEGHPGALWDRESMLEPYRVTHHPDLSRVVIPVDPPGTSTGAECGIVPVGSARHPDGVMHYYVLADHSLRGKPGEWGTEVVTAYHYHHADRVVGEVNNGGDMVEHTIKGVEGGEHIPFTAVRASRGKAVRAEPVAARYQRGVVHHVGRHQELEGQLCNWVPGSGPSPDRLDSLVWGITHLMGTDLGSMADTEQPESKPSRWDIKGQEGETVSKWRL